MTMSLERKTDELQKSLDVLVERGKKWAGERAGASPPS